MSDYKQLVEEERNKSHIRELRERMDSDARVRELAKYVMKDAYQKAISGIINVTLNRPAVFFANVFAALGNASEQIVAESDNDDFDARYVEEFRKLAFISADERLRLKGRPRLSPYIDEQSCIRGRAGARCLFRMKGDVLIPDITPWDMRNVVYHIGDELDWAA